MKVEKFDAGRETIASAPGKSMLSGGFAVLYPKTSGLVLSLDAKFFARISESTKSEIEILNPQFPSSDFLYKEHECLPRNLFLEASFEVLTHYLKPEGLKCSAFKVSLFMDSFFFSKSKMSTSSEVSLASISKTFPRFEVSLFDCPKTGLGSSACLVVSVVLGVLTFLRSRPAEENEVFWLSWLVTRTVQGSSSGFDVSSAVYGSQIFSSFELGDFEAKKNLFWNDLKEFKRQISSFKGPENRLNFAPDDFSAIFFDLDRGTKSASFSKKIIEFFSERLKEKDAFNSEITEITTQLSPLLQAKALSENLKVLNKKHHKILSKLSLESHVEVQPEILSRFFEKVLEDFDNGLWYVISPGAGGFDAFVVLTKSFGKDLEKLNGDLLNYAQEFFKNDTQSMKVSSFICRVL